MLWRVVLGEHCAQSQRRKRGHAEQKLQTQTGQKLFPLEGDERFVQQGSKGNAPKTFTAPPPSTFMALAA